MLQRSQDLAFGKFVLRANDPYHEKMSLLIALLLSLTASHADDVVEIHKDTPVYQKSAPGSKILFTLHDGDKVSASPSKSPEFLKVRLQRKGKWLQGFAQRADIPSPTESLGHEATRGEWGLGAGGEYTSLLQKGKTFQTDDQVQYTTTDYKSLSFGPFIVLQYHYEDFWRLTVAQKKTHYLATATPNIVGSKTKDIDLQQTFYSFLLQKAWMPLERKNFYYGIGVEAAKATAVSVSLGGSELVTSSSDFPIYVGPMIFWGGTLSFTPTTSIFLEGRFGYIANQSPGIYSLEVALGLLYWP